MNFKDYDHFDVAEALYLWLASMHGGQESCTYSALCQLEEIFKPSPSLSEENLETQGLEIFDQLTLDNYESALEYVQSYKPQD